MLGNYLKLNRYKFGSISSFFFTEKKIVIPFNLIDLSFSRSSGAGGQGVNKLNTKVEMRFHLDSANWIDEEVKKRLAELYPNRINSSGEFILTSQEHRTQEMNRSEAKKKLQQMVDIASIPKKERIIEPYTETAELEQKRLKGKKIRSDIKKMRTNPERH